VRRKEEEGERGYLTHSVAARLIVHHMLIYSSARKIKHEIKSIECEIKKRKREIKKGEKRKREMRREGEECVRGQ
jgi:predicted RNA-binding protein with PIN domain